MDVGGCPSGFCRTFESLKKKNKQNKVIIAGIQNIIDELKEDRITGDQIKRVQIPKYYIKKYEINTLFRVKVSSSWRLIYTILVLKNQKQALILEVLNHDDYNKRFGYK